MDDKPCSVKFGVRDQNEAPAILDCVGQAHVEGHSDAPADHVAVGFDLAGKAHLFGKNVSGSHESTRHLEQSAVTTSGNHGVEALRTPVPGHSRSLSDGAGSMNLNEVVFPARVLQGFWETSFVVSSARDRIEHEKILHDRGTTGLRRDNS